MSAAPISPERCLRRVALPAGFTPPASCNRLAGLLQRVYGAQDWLCRLARAVAAAAARAAQQFRGKTPQSRSPLCLILQNT